MTTSFPQLAIKRCGPTDQQDVSRCRLWRRRLLGASLRLEGPISRDRCLEPAEIDGWRRAGASSDGAKRVPARKRSDGAQHVGERPVASRRMRCTLAARTYRPDSR